MTKHPRQRRAFLFLPILALAGCFEYTEELSLRKNGSARLVTDISVLDDLVDPDELPGLREKIRQGLEDLRQSPDILEAEFEDFTSDAMHHFVFRIAARDARWFEGSHLDNALFALRDDLGGKPYRFEELEDGRTRVTRSFDTDQSRLSAKQRLQTARAKRTGVLGDGFNPDNPFEDKFFTFVIRAPKILKATEGSELGSSEARWRYALDDDEAEIPAELSVEYKLQTLGWLAWAGIFALIGGLMLWFRSFWSRGMLRKSLRKTGIL